MFYSLDFRIYQKRFIQPLQTHHGKWEIREGILISLQDDLGRIGQGEIAPIPWFGTESLDGALSFCQRLPKIITQEIIDNIPDDLPACQFGFESALTDLLTEEKYLDTDCLDGSFLLPAGEQVLDAWQMIWQEKKPNTFKWKIGVNPQEIKIFHQLDKILPTEIKLRLDANGGLNLAQTKEWLKIGTDTNRIEFIEQPLAVDRFEDMLELSEHYSIPLALDESVANLQKLEYFYHRGWRGIFIIKPAIIGSPKKLARLCQKYSLDAVFSSALETDIGRKAALQLAQKFSNPQRAIGFGVDNWFIEAL